MSDLQHFVAQPQPSCPPLLGCLLSSALMATMGVFAAADCLHDMFRPCVDCGRLTGNFCDNDCPAEQWCPSEQWCDGQLTPQCTVCEKQHVVCHYCREVPSCTPAAWGASPRCECPRCLSDNPNEPAPQAR